MDIKQLMEKYGSYVIEMRRHFHQYPELSFEEFETTQTIAAELEKMGIPYEINPQKNTGLVAVIKGKLPGKAVALRADIDALNVTEQNTFEYKSKHDGKMHACGHDAHAAILLGAAKILNELKDELKGTVYLVFQPAEEIGKGALAMIEQGDWYEKVDNVFGAHVWSHIPSGSVSVEEGPRMAAADRFTIKIKGKSGHGSLPNETVDAVVVASATVMNLQTLVSRHFNPLDSIVITVGSIHSGNRFNIIAGDAVLEGTIRYFSPEIGRTIDQDVRHVVDSTAQMYGATAELDYEFILPPTINDAASAELGAAAVSKILGPEALYHEPMTTGGEDFSFYLQNKPGAFAFIGTRNPAVGSDVAHHNECFTVDDEALPAGAAIYAQYALDFLNQAEA